MPRMRWQRSWLVTAALVLTGCAQASSDENGNVTADSGITLPADAGLMDAELPSFGDAQRLPDDDGGLVEVPDAAAPAPDAMVPRPDASPTPQPTAITLSHSSSPTVTQGNSVACQYEGSGATSENSYYRVFALGEFGIASQLEIASITIGVQLADAGSGTTQPATLRIYTLNGPFTLANLQEIASTSVSISDQSLSLLDIPIGATAPMGSTIVVELAVPDGQSAGHKFYFGSNGAGQSAPSYLRAPGCSTPQPTDIATLPGITTPVHLVMQVSGTHYR